MLKMCELKFCLHYRYSPYLKKKNKKQFYTKPSNERGISKFLQKWISFFFLVWLNIIAGRIIAIWNRQAYVLWILSSFLLDYYQEMHLNLLFFCHCKLKFCNWALVVWLDAHQWPEAPCPDRSEIEEHIFNLLYTFVLLVPLSKLNSIFSLLGFVLVGALKPNLSTLYSRLSNLIYVPFSLVRESRS